VKIIKKISVVFILLLLIHPFSVELQANNKKPRYIIVIVADSLRPDHMGCYGYSRITTPFIDQKSKEALVFDNAFSTGSNTKAAISSLFCGLYVFQHKVANFGRAGDFFICDSLPDNILTVTEALKNNGVKTFGLYSLGILDSEYGHAQGFDEYIKIDEKEFLGILKEKLKNNKNDRLFFYLHFESPHVPYAPSAEIIQEFDILNNENLKGYPYDKKMPLSNAQTKDYKAHQNVGQCMLAYDREIFWIDKQFKEIWEFLEEEKVLQDSLLIFLADHGEEFLEHGRMGHGGPRLFDEIIRIPLIIWNLKQAEPKRIDRAVSIIDLYPTILVSVGCNMKNFKNNFRLYGKDLFKTDKIPPDRGVIAEFPDENADGEFLNLGKIIFRTKDKKIYLDNDFGNMAYYKITDNREMKQEDDREFAKEKKGFLAMLSRIKYAYSKERRPMAKKSKYDGKELEHLKSLGYLQ
jgi:arylsulfatase A-like enzyme